MRMIGGELEAMASEPTHALAWRAGLFCTRARPRCDLCPCVFLPTASDVCVRRDVVLTCFFLDACPSVPEACAQMRAVLRPGGLWLNHGPLLYHCNRSAAPVPRLCGDELLLLVERSGFELVETADHACSYSQDPQSMCVSQYRCLFFCARKV